MSGKQSGKVWDYEFTKGEKSVMLALADHAHHDGTGIYPSMARIAWKTDYSKRQVQRLVRSLVESGVLVLVKKATQHTTNEYRIDWTKAIKKEPFRGDTTPNKNSPGVTSKKSRGDIALSPKTSVKRPLTVPSKGTVVEYVDVGNEFGDKKPKKKSLTPQQNMVGALSMVTGFSFKKVGGRLGKAARTLLADDNTPEEVIKAFGPNSAWYKVWPGTENRKPKPEQVVAEIDNLLELPATIENKSEAYLRRLNERRKSSIDS